MTTTTLTAPARLNGIDLTALRGMIEQVRSNPRQGKADFRVTTQWAGGCKTDTRVDDWALDGVAKQRGFVIRTDEPTELCGAGVAPNPQEVLMAGLNACMMVGWVACSSLLGVTLESIEIETEGRLDLRGFLGLSKDVKPGYDDLSVTVRVKGDGTEEQMRQVHAMVQATSPNFFNLTQRVRIAPELEAERSA